MASANPTMTPPQSVLPGLAVDAAIALPAITIPAWWPFVNEAMHVILLLGGVALVWLRIALAIRDLRSRRQDRDRDKYGPRE